MSEIEKEDIISLSLKHGALFSDLDRKTQDNLIKEICSRILNFEARKEEMSNIKKSKVRVP